MSRAKYQRFTIRFRRITVKDILASHAGEEAVPSAVLDGLLMATYIHVKYRLSTSAETAKSAALGSTFPSEADL